MNPSNAPSPTNRDAKSKFTQKPEIITPRQHHRQISQKETAVPLHKFQAAPLINEDVVYGLIRL